MPSDRTVHPGIADRVKYSVGVVRDDRMDVIQASDITKTIGDRAVLDSVHVSAGQKRITGVVGESEEQVRWLFDVLAGIVIPDGGTVRRSADIVSNPMFYVRWNDMDDPLVTCSGHYRRTSSAYPFRDDGLFRDLCVGYGIQPDARLISLSPATRRLFDLIVGISCHPSLLIAQDPLADADDDTYDMMIGDLEKANRTGTSILISSPSAEELEEFCHDVIDLRRRDFRVRDPIDAGDGRIIRDRMELPKAPCMYAPVLISFLIVFASAFTPSNLISVLLGCAALETVFFMSDVGILSGRDAVKVCRGADRTSIEAHRCAFILLCSLVAAVSATAFCLLSAMGTETAVAGASIAMVFLPIAMLSHRAMLSYDGTVCTFDMIAHLLLLPAMFVFMAVGPGSVTFGPELSVAIVAVCIAVSALLTRDCIGDFRKKDLVIMRDMPSERPERLAAIMNEGLMTIAMTMDRIDACERGRDRPVHG